MTGLFGIGPAVFVHEGSTLVVIGNVLRCLRYESGTTGPPAAPATADMDTAVRV